MANDFKIYSHRTESNLHLNLAGDFDGSSALELLNILKENLDNIARVSIDTSNLKKIHPFGRQVFNHKFSRFKHHRICAKFIGNNVGQITST
jgi:ABC-type transporter Mla MlaB component